MRVVLDPNVLVSALISRSGPPRELVDLWIAGRFELVASPKLIGELRDVLERPKFRRWASFDTVSEYVGGFEDGAISVEDPEDPEPLCPDPDDDYLLALAKESEADFLISGDPDLKDLENPVPPVLTPRQFRDRFDES